MQKFFQWNWEDVKVLFSSALVVILLFMLIFGYLFRNLQMSSLRYEISRLKKKEKKTYLELESLRLQVARYSTASRIETLFKEKYGYLPVQIGQRITTLQLPDVINDPMESGKNLK